jgi:hypothetical protein
MHGPKREHVEPVLRHHVEVSFPELEVFARFPVLLENGAGAVREPLKTMF